MLSWRPKEGVHEAADTLELCVERGVLGDRWAHHCWMTLPDGRSDPRVQVSVTNFALMSMITGSKENARDCGDNIFVDFDLTEANLPVGAQFKIGEAVLEVSDIENDACGKFAKRFGAEAFQWIRQPENQPLRLRGIFCKIIQGGKVRIGDRVSADL